jgi:hypothetical protein
MQVKLITKKTSIALQYITQARPIFNNWKIKTKKLKFQNFSFNSKNQRYSELNRVVKIGFGR